MTTSLKQLMEQDAGRPVPPAPVDRVLARGQARVRRRWTAGAVAAVVLAVLAIAIPVGFLGDKSTDQPIGPPGSETLTFTSKAGPSFTVDDAQVRCDGQTLYVIAGSRQVGPDGNPRGSVYRVEVHLDKTTMGMPVELPVEYPNLFVYDAEHDNELSTATETSRGTLTVNEASCGSTPSVDFSVDATVGSEFFETSGVRVKGRVVIAD